MSVFSLEHSQTAYRVDFALYGASIVALASYLVWASPRGGRLELLALTLVGLVSWTLIEYVLHRFFLHGIQPFRHWHATHHERPTALICAPTLLSATLIVLLVFVPTMLLGDWWLACALTLGVLIGYLSYSVTHHAIHHWPAKGRWLKRRKRAHALHHHLRQRGFYGVTSGIWDEVFRTGSVRSAVAIPLLKNAAASARQPQRLPDRKARAAQL
jgi:sterol desaturase/sphingolipid hydroxylase (fatty acid hydroxylase superfamily)